MLTSPANYTWRLVTCSLVQATATQACRSALVSCHHPSLPSLHRHPTTRVVLFTPHPIMLLEAQTSAVASREKPSLRNGLQGLPCQADDLSDPIPYTEPYSFCSAARHSLSRIFQTISNPGSYCSISTIMSFPQEHSLIPHLIQMSMPPTLCKGTPICL